MVCPEGGDGGFGCVKVLPLYGLRGAEGGLVDVAVRGCAGDAAEVDGFYEKGICRAEDGADIEVRADIVQHDDDGQLLIRFELLGGEAGEFGVLEFAHGQRQSTPDFDKALLPKEHSALV